MTPFKLNFQVRDYELDMLGMVNNAVYQNYLEHSRHEFLKSLGVDFAAMYTEGYRLVVRRAELDYHFTLSSGDKFYVETSLKRISRIKFEFNQCIILEENQKPVLTGKIIGTALNERGRPSFPKSWEKIFPEIEK